MDLFQEAVKHLRARDINNFAIKLIDFYNQLTCDCYWRNQKVGLFEELLSFIDMEEEKENENNFYWNLTIGYLLIKSKKEEEAFKYLSRAIDNNPYNDLAYAFRSAIDKKINPQRLEDARSALKFNPTARNNFKYASSCGDSNDDKIKEAIVFYKKAIELNSNFACAHLNISNCYDKLKDFDNKIQHLKFCLELEPNHWGGYKNLWTELHNKKAYEEAYKVAETAYRLFPNESYYIYAFARANFSLHKYEEAIKLLQDYLLVESDNLSAEKELSSAYYTLWVLLHNKKAYEEAYKIAETGYKLFPNDSDYLYALGIANYKLDKYEEAIKLFLDYLKLKPDNTRIKELLNDALVAQPKKHILKEALKMSDEENYLKSIELFEKYLVEFELFNSEHTLLAKNKLKVAKNLLIKLPLKEAMKMYSIGNYLVAVKNFGIYMETQSLRYDIKGIDAYYFCLLKTNHIDSSEENPFYKNLINLTLSYFKKTEPSEVWYFNTANIFADRSAFEDLDYDEFDDDEFDEIDSDDTDSDENVIKSGTDFKEINEESLIVQRKDLVLTEDEENANKLKAYDYSSTLNFGKYQGLKLNIIIDLEPSYILWCIINLIHFSVDKSILLDKKFRMQDDFLLAVEINYIKGVVLNKREKWKDYKKWLEDKRNNDDDNDYDYDDDYDYQKGTFDALTDGQYGDYDDWREEGGDIGSLKDGLGF